MRSSMGIGLIVGSVLQSSGRPGSGRKIICMMAPNAFEWDVRNVFERVSVFMTVLAC